jgi:light-regulated signal transduction histidine kinase (bacteriophytochrome)
MTAIIAHLKEHKLHQLNQFRRFQNEAIQEAPRFLLTIIVVALLIFAVAAFVIIKFIRSLVKIQLDLAYKIEEAEKANKELDLYAFTLTHHLQEPLRKVRLFISRFETKNKIFLTEGGHQDEKIFLDKALESAELAQKYLDEFLDFSRLLHHDKIEKTAVNLNIIIEKVLKEYQTIIQEKNANITVDNMPIIMSGETQMHALWSHLIDNALKFSDPEKLPMIKIENIKNENKMIHLRISDNGIGFDMTHSEKIFDIFQRLHKSRLNKGMGIGLAVCKRVVEAHKGNITVKSEPNQGTIFDVYFPASVMAI